MNQIDPVFDRNRFLLRQKHWAISEKYYVWDEQNKPLLYVERPMHGFRNFFAGFLGIVAGIFVMILLFMIAASVPPTQGFLMAFLFLMGFIGCIVTIFVVFVPLSQKRHVTFYRDDTRQERLLEVLQDRKFQGLNATYTVRDPEGQLLAKLRKNYLYDMLRKRWYGYAQDGSILFVAKEDSIILSLLRRLLGILFGFLRTNFVILDGRGNVIGEFNRKFTILDRYVLDMNADSQKSIDRRIALALGVMLDTGERR